MKVKIERFGGFSGLKAEGERDFSELSPEQRVALDRVRSAQDQATPSPGADRFYYKVTIVDENGTQEFDVPEDAMPDELASIVKINP